MTLQDFTLISYSTLIEKFINKNYLILNFKNFLQGNYDQQRILILRHDVDKKPNNSLEKAKIENKLGISATYYFRIVKESFNESIITTIANLGHEIGFHYEDLTIAKGNLDKAYDLFKKNLQKIRAFYPVSTICMHGSPMSKWNNLDIWKKFDYRINNIIGEPNLDLNFDEIFYLTDTGMSWNQSKYSIRDIAKGKFSIQIKSLNDIFYHLERETLPDKIMLNTHPQRWSDNLFELIWEKSRQLLKNQVKRLMKIKYEGYINAD